MSIVPASNLSRADLLSLGNNVLPEVRSDRGGTLLAINRSLEVHGEEVNRLYKLRLRPVRHRIPRPVSA